MSTRGQGRWIPERVRRAIALGSSLPIESVERRARDGRPDGLPRTGRRAPHRAGVMNGLERSYAEHLLARQLAGEVRLFLFEPLKLRLARRTWYAPDFLVVLPDGQVECHEVKGHWEDDARVKVKVAAELHGWARFVAARRGARGGAQFVLEELPGPVDAGRGAPARATARGPRPSTVSS